ncbi:MAG: DUF4230 domain-containing protein [Lachnospiraceae bacterium]|nr:DUF4230 domain-containing protein [Lachnospiraceae bacterium]
MKKVGKIILVLVLIAAIVEGALLFRGGLKTSSQTQSLSFKNIGELATQEADVVQVEKIEKDALQDKTGIDIPFVGTEIVYSYLVAVKAGYDFSEITTDVDQAAKTVTVHMPEAKILSADVNTDSYQCYTDYQSVFNLLSQDDQNTALEQLKSDAQETALSNGLLDKARTNAETLLTNMIVGQLTDSSYTISFEY